MGCETLAKKITYPITFDVTINESELALLQFLNRRLAGKEMVSLTAKEIREKLGVSDSSIRRCYKSLAKKGLIYVGPGFREDGSCAGNIYAVTLVGFTLLDLEKEQKLSKKKPAEKKPAKAEKDAARKIPAPQHV